MVEVLTDLATFGQRGRCCAETTGVDNGARHRASAETAARGLVGITLDPGNLIVNGIALRST